MQDQMANLKVSQDVARTMLEERVSLGQQLLVRPLNYHDDIEVLKHETTIWSDHNAEMLSRMFDTDQYLREYTKPYPHATRSITTFQQDCKSARYYGLERRLTFLKSLVGRLVLIPSVDAELSTALQMLENPTTNSPGNMRSVFVVHGHDDVVRLKVTMFLEKIGLTPIVLHEQANAGRTIIEEFEIHSDVQFAVILLTPDDAGAVINSQASSSPRARQNVIFEWGYFVAKLGRRNVFALNKGVEIPSDMSGILYEPYDDADGWHLKLAREMKAAGLEVDLNKAI